MRIRRRGRSKDSSNSHDDNRGGIMRPPFLLHREHRTQRSQNFTDTQHHRGYHSDGAPQNGANDNNVQTRFPRFRGGRRPKTPSQTTTTNRHNNNHSKVGSSIYSDDGCSLDSFVSTNDRYYGTSIGTSGVESDPYEFVEFEQNRGRATSGRQRRKKKNSLRSRSSNRGDDSIDPFDSDNGSIGDPHATSQPASPFEENRRDSYKNNYKNRAHALSYGGSFDSDDDALFFEESNCDQSHYSESSVGESPKYEPHRNSSMSISRSQHLQLSHTLDDYRGDPYSSAITNNYHDDDSESDSDVSFRRNRRHNNSLRRHSSPRSTPDMVDMNQRFLEHMAKRPSNEGSKRIRKGEGIEDKLFRVVPDYAYRTTTPYMTRKQLRAETNSKSAFYHDVRLYKEASQSKTSSKSGKDRLKNFGELRVEILQCYGLPTTSLIKEVSAYAVAVHEDAAFQTDMIPNIANPMWLSKMRRACMFGVSTMYSQLYIGLFDLEPLIADPDDVVGHIGHPGWLPPDQRARRGSFGFGGRGEGRMSFGGGANGNREGRANFGVREGRLSFGGGSREMHLSNVDQASGRIGRSGSIGSRRGSGNESNKNDTDAEDDDDLDDTIKCNDYCARAEDFIGHVVIDVCKLRPGTTYDVTLPLRRSKHVFSRDPRGSVRVRLHLTWNSERSAVLSYLPRGLPGGTTGSQLSNKPNTRFTINCVDDRAARNVAHTIHGVHMPGKFDPVLVKATMREIHWTRIHLFRYLRQKQIYNLCNWVYPSISGFCFLAWMHAVYYNTVRYFPGHVVVFFLLHLIKNYSYYAMDSPLQNGFLGPTLEELYMALMHPPPLRKRGKKGTNGYIHPLNMQLKEDAWGATASDHLRSSASRNNSSKNSDNMDELYDENGDLVNVSRFSLTEIANAMREKLRVQPYRNGLTIFQHSFQGEDAVDFLVNNGYAKTRPEAVGLGRRLESEKGLFADVTGEARFEDSTYVYAFRTGYENERFVIKKSHVPRGGRFLELLGFYSRSGKQTGEHHVGNKKNGKNTDDIAVMVGGADILEAREHVEFPFATGVDHPRFTVKESLVIHSPEKKSKVEKEKQARDVLESAEFGIIPTSLGSSANSNDNQRANNVSGYESETGTKMTGNARISLKRTSSGRLSDGFVNGGKKITDSARRGSMIVGEAVKTVATGVATGVVVGANAVAEGLIWGNRQDANPIASTGSLLEVAVSEEDIYKKLKDQNNLELDRLIELQRKADAYDPYQYDSDNDVGNIQKKKRKKHVIFEKHLKEPRNQEIGGNIHGQQQSDMSLARALDSSRRQLHRAFYHMFDDQVYKIDENLFPTQLDKDAGKEMKKKKKRRLFNRRVSNEEMKLEEERQKRMQMTPYEKQKEEIDKVLLINEHSHWNPWMNRIGIVIQPLLEMAQTFLFATRASFNVMTWQDPVLCFWLCFVGPPLVLLLYIAPYRLFALVLGLYWIGPQNYLLRVYRETRPGYQPPDFDLVVKKKKIEKAEDFQEMQFFSSDAPGNQQIRFQNIDPTHVKQIVVPSNVLMYNRFYDWPPEPEYARVYASSAPKNLIVPGVVVDDPDNDGYSTGYESGDISAFIFDQAARLNPVIKKKKKKGFRKVTSRINKGTRGFVKDTVAGTERVVGSTAGLTIDAVRGTAKITTSVVKGTGKQAKSAAKGTGNFLGLRNRKKSKAYEESDEDYY
ncbi:unnamed protein product [Pseudo-nitzschia multistriata]|uniref:DEP domain-containing protein n=1 Tax=Pseudo-nitzschia multistriata TaxID=183589 RepID=A0A448ZA72_9STRA|nr:unnamed protein product [Pseudo-nitzschia multistriata]